MVLLLDASSQDFHFPGLYSPYNSVHTSITIDRLHFLFNLELRGDLLNKIDSAVLFNLDANELSMTDVKNWVNALKSKRSRSKKLSKTDRRIIELLQKLTLYNYKDLGLEIFDLSESKLVDNKLFILWCKPLEELVKDKEVVFVGEWVSKYSIVLAEHLKNVRWYKKNSRGYFELVDDSKKYIEYYKNFYTKKYANKTKFEKSLVQYKRFLEDPFKNVFLYTGQERNYFETKDPSHSIASKVNKIMFVGDNELFINKFLKKIPAIDERYYWYNCSEDKYKVKQYMDGLVFRCVDKLSATSRVELLSDISASEYRDKPVFLISKEQISLSPDSNFIPVAIPTNGECKKFFHHFLRDLIYEKNLIVESKMQVFDSLYAKLYDSGNLDELLDRFISLSEMDQFLNNLCLDRKIKTDFLHLDFWYELLINYESSDRLEVNSNLKNFPSEPYLLRKNNDDKYQVIFNGRELNFENRKLDGFFYLCVLLKNPNRAQSGNELFKIKVGENYIYKSDGVELTDNRTLKEVNENIEKLKRLKQNFIDSGDVTKPVEIQEEIDKLYKYINNNTRFDENNPQKKRGVKKTASRKDNYWRNVKGAMDRLKKEILETDREFYKYFITTIKEDSQLRNYIYVPQTDIKWKVDS